MGKRSQRNRERVAGTRPGANEPKPWSRRATKARMRQEAIDKAKRAHPSHA